MQSVLGERVVLDADPEPDNECRLFFFNSVKALEYRQSLGWLSWHDDCPEQYLAQSEINFQILS